MGEILDEQKCFADYIELQSGTVINMVSRLEWAWKEMKDF